MNPTGMLLVLPATLACSNRMSLAILAQEQGYNLLGHSMRRAPIQPQRCLARRRHLETRPRARPYEREERIKRSIVPNCHMERRPIALHEYHTRPRIRPEKPLDDLRRGISPAREKEGGGISLRLHLAYGRIDVEEAMHGRRIGSKVACNVKRRPRILVPGAQNLWHGLGQKGNDPARRMVSNGAVNGKVGIVFVPGHHRGLKIAVGAKGLDGLQWWIEGACQVQCRSTE